MLNELEKQKIFNDIVNTLQSEGYSPYEQLTGYLKSGNERYITRKNNARSKIRLLDLMYINEKLKSFL